MNPQKETFSAMGSGYARTPGVASVREAVPIEAVGHATRAMSARRRSSGVLGWAATNEWPSPSAKTSGATRRQVSQSMHERST